jgi:hypothetical protein
MPRPSAAEHYELTEAEKRDLIALIQAGKPRDVTTAIDIFGNDTMTLVPMTVG